MSELATRFLGELIQIRKGKKPASVRTRKRKDSDKPYLLIESFGGDYKSFTDDSSCPYASKEDTLLVWDGERCGLTSTGHDGYIGSTLASISRSADELEPSYLYHFLASKRKEIRNSAEGTGVPHVSRRFLEDLEIHIPPLPEQKKIAEILSGIDNLITKKEKQIRTLENLRMSVLDALTDEELRKGTKCAPLSEIVSPERKITYGIVQAGPDIKGGIPYIRVTDMSDEELDVNKMLRTSPEIAAKFKRSEVQEGDIVVALRGIIGATHLIDDRTSGANLTQGTALLSKSNKCLPLYVNTILKSRFCSEQFSLLSKGSTIVEITLSSLATLMIPLPTISTQEHIANSIASIKRQISSSKKSLASTRSMKNAIASELLSGRKRVSV